MEAAGAGLKHVIIDSSLWIEYYHPQGDPAVQWAVMEALLADRVATVPIVVVEVAQGVRTRGDLSRVLHDFRAYHTIPLDAEVTEIAASLLFALKRAGYRVPVTDALIAAAATATGAELWHLSDEHYERLAAAAPEVLQGRSLSTRAFSRRA